MENPQLHPFCLPASAAASLLLSCCTKCSQGRALWILQQPLPTINHCQQLTTATTTITGTLQQGCVQVLQEDPILLQRGTQRGMHQQEGQNCCSLQEPSSSSPRKKPSRACHPPALVLSNSASWTRLRNSYKVIHTLAQNAIKQGLIAIRQQEKT